MYIKNLTLYDTISQGEVSLGVSTSAAVVTQLPKENASIKDAQVQ